MKLKIVSNKRSDKFRASSLDHTIKKMTSQKRPRTGTVPGTV